MIKCMTAVLLHVRLWIPRYCAHCIAQQHRFGILMDCLALQEFYEATVKHRRLTWYYHSGQATIKGNFKAKPIDMLMSTTQAAVVLLFNSG